MPKPSFWRLLIVAISLLTLIPLVFILWSVLNPDWEIWRHLLDYSLPELLLNTLYLVLGVGVGVLLLGVPLAWLVAVYDFPGRWFFHWALMLPLAMPAYVMAFSQLGLFDFTGPLQSWLRDEWGDSSWVPNIRSTAGVIVVMSLAFYPYVYLLARNAFTSMGRRSLEVGQALGFSPWQSFWRVVLPMARPWIVGGMSLALMETLADFGTVAIFNFDTFTTAIYKAWFSLFSLPAAKQLASLLVLMVLLLVWLEQRERGRRAYTAAGKSGHLARSRLQGWPALASVMLCSVVLLAAFVLPFGQILYWAWLHLEEELTRDFWGYVGNSLGLSVMAALVVTALALGLSYAVRRDASRFGLSWGRLATLGYAMPGTVLAVGVFVPIAFLDNVLLSALADYLPAGSTAILKGTLLVVMLAYSARFLAVGYSAVDAAMHRITPSQEEAARNLGQHGWGLLRRLHLPLLRGGLFTALLMVFVDVMKEMPITLMTRPYGWDTLAIRVFNLTTEGEWERAALPSVAIVLAGLLPVVILSRQQERTKHAG